MEKDMKEICEGTKGMEEVKAECIRSMLQIFRKTLVKKLNIISLFRDLMSKPFDLKMPSSRN